MKVSEQVARVLRLSCGDELRSKGCWTARNASDPHPNGIRGDLRCSPTLAAQALENQECICDSYESARKALQAVIDLEHSGGTTQDP